MNRIFRSAPSRLPLIAFSIFFGMSLLMRIILFLTAIHDVSFDASLLGIFGIGVFMDAVTGLFAAFPWVLYAVVAPDFILKSVPGRWITVALMVFYTSLMVFISVSEYFFWDEFGARFNFIAVDYLIWTQEVLGNIMESYPMVPIIGGIVLVAVGIVWALCRKGALAWAVNDNTRWTHRLAMLAIGLILPTLAVQFVSQSSLPAFKNQYHTELAKNGCWSFIAAGKQMELDYEQWYPKIPAHEALVGAKKRLVRENEVATTDSPEDLRRTVKATGPENKWNVILICMESFSGDYMTYAGNKRGITPNLDRLSRESIFFDKLYATGTRTVRGMEALTLNLPPTPGQSIIYRPEGRDLVTTFSPFLKRGYDCAFFYGGDGKFDYMNRFFSTSGCRIMDVMAWDKADTTFKTSWGACDEDLFNKTISEADKNFAAGKPFHYFCMTTSNHRPFHFPENRVSTHAQGTKSAAVKYSDWAVGKLIDDASKKPWFKNTLFVFCADHCASSAGKSDLDVTKFHIPAMIYNPGLVQAKTVSRLCSQIDLMPTVFGLLNWEHDTLGYGHDLLAPGAETLPERAFISNYQKIALLQNDSLAILKPKRQSSLYNCDVETGNLSPISPEKSGILEDATIFYQSASWIFKNNKLKSALYKTPAPPQL